ncbi:hypothetical protein [Amycolatopsis sp. MEPSY49]|uniref:hypothetical protein n=1 Tax=Amycolatopsis sp. MEPSY49 TaxID=3151600 RepID=UPI003EF97078
MFGRQKKLNDPNDLMARLRPDVSRESLGISFRGIADEDLTITELTRLAPDPP